MLQVGHLPELYEDARCEKKNSVEYVTWLSISPPPQPPPHETEYNYAMHYIYIYIYIYVY